MFDFTTLICPNFNFQTLFSEKVDFRLNQLRKLNLTDIGARSAYIPKLNSKYFFFGNRIRKAKRTFSLAK